MKTNLHDLEPSISDDMKYALLCIKIGYQDSRSFRILNERIQIKVGLVWRYIDDWWGKEYTHTYIKAGKARFKLSQFRPEWNENQPT